MGKEYIGTPADDKEELGAAACNVCAETSYMHIFEAPSHPLSILAFLGLGGAEFSWNPLKVKLLAGDLRAAQM